MSKFVRVSNLLKENYPSLTICSNNGSPVKVMQWQCNGQITIDRMSGVKKEDVLFLNKARKFIEESSNLNADLVLTPEYSFPFTVLEEIVNNKLMWPKSGQLWCLGAQGENRTVLGDIFKRWHETPNVNLVDCAAIDLENNNFISSLIYLFRTNDQNLCILPQYKIGSMADGSNTFEGPYLCRGKQIFVFDFTSEKCENVFLSLICADALRVPASDVIREIPERYIILFHPQLNPDPRHTDLVSFRKILYSTGQKDTRIITLNWAEGTYGDYDNHSYKFDIPWSAYFKKPTAELSNRSLRNSKEVSHKKGTPYIISDHIEIWFSDRIEHCKFFIISKGDNGSSVIPVVHRDDPTTENIYSYDEQVNSWVPGQLGCASNIRNVFSEFEIPMDLPYPVCTIDEDACDRCKKTDYFYGSLFGKFENSEIICSSEQIARLLVASDKESDSLRRQKFDMLICLKRLLANGEVPNSLNYLKDNYMFKVSEDFPLQGLDQYNIAPINITHHDGEALVVITNEMNISAVAKLVKELGDCLNSRYRNQILVYYKSPGNGYIFYDKHLSDKSITQPSYSSSQTSIKHGISKIVSLGGM